MDAWPWLRYHRGSWHRTGKWFPRQPERARVVARCELLWSSDWYGKNLATDGPGDVVGSRPRGRLLVLLPIRDQGAQFVHFGDVLRGDIGGFVFVDLEIEQQRVVAVGRLSGHARLVGNLPEFPVAGADGNQGRTPPDQDIMGLSRRLARDERQEIDTIVGAIRRQMSAGSGHGGRQQIHQ